MSDDWRMWRNKKCSHCTTAVFDGRDRLIFLESRRVDKKGAKVFQELMPLLAKRTVLLMVSSIGPDEVRISVIPQRVKSADIDQNDALLTPLSISGTPKELDEALPAQLKEFIGAHLGLSSTLKSVKEQMDAAAKAAKESARKQVGSKSVESPTKAAPSNVAPSAASTAASALSSDSSSAGLTEATTGNLFAS